METLSRVKRKKKEKEQKRKSKGLTTLRALLDFSRIVGLLVRLWDFLKDYFNDFFL